MRKTVVIIIMLLWGVSFSPAHAQAPAGQEYTVRSGDTLSGLAGQYLGGLERYAAIVEATNAKAAEDSSFTAIENPDLIEVGQKLWIPVLSPEEETAPIVQSDTVVGIYKTMLPGASSPGLDVTLYLNLDGSAREVTDYLNDEAPIVEIGNWGIVANQVELTFTGQADRDYEAPVVKTLRIEANTLVEVREEFLPGAYVTRYLPFEGLALGTVAVPYDAAQAAEQMAASGFSGIYKGFLPAATCCGRDMTMTLSPDGPARLKTDFLNGEPPILQEGTWESVGETRLDITWSGAESPLMLEALDGVLRTTADEDEYGQAGLTLYDFGTIALNANWPVVTGTVSYRERIALPPEALITVRLVDISRADAPAEVLAEQVITAGGQQPPFPFELPYNPRVFDPSHTYAVQARIEVNGELRFISTSVYPVLTRGAPGTVEVMVESVDGAAAAGAEACAAVPVSVSAETPPERSSYLAYGPDSPVGAGLLDATLTVDSQADNAGAQWREAALSGLGYCTEGFAPQQVTIYTAEPGTATVVALANVQFDDSVTAQEVRLDLADQGDGQWQVTWGGVRFRCARGENTTELQAALCP